MVDENFEEKNRDSMIDERLRNHRKLIRGTMISVGILLLWSVAISIAHNITGDEGWTQLGDAMFFLFSATLFLLGIVFIFFKTLRIWGSGLLLGLVLVYFLSIFNIF